jgi:hypothetical protein
MSDLFGDLAISPRMFPEEIDFNERVMHFCEMTRKAYAQSAFLDERKIRLDAIGYKVGLDYLLNNFGVSAGPEKAINWIFHTPHSGSTLIARALDEIEGCFVLKEPTLLIQCSSLKRHPDFPVWEKNGDWHRFFTMVQALLSRTFEEKDMALIKTTSVCHNLVDDIFGGTRAARGLFLYSSLEKYLVSLYKGNYLDAYIKSGFDGALHDMRNLLPMDPGEAGQLPRNRKVALLWLTVVAGLSRYMETGPGKKLLALDCQDFFSQREATLIMLADHFGYPHDTASIKTVVDGAVFDRDAKMKNKVWDVSVVSDMNKQVRDRFSVEIEDAIHWVEELNGESGLQHSLPLFSQ